MVAGARSIAKAIQEHLTSSEKVVWATTTEGTAVVGAWGERKTVSVLVVDTEYQPYEIVILPNSPPEGTGDER